jgi:hypothetical protein
LNYYAFYPALLIIDVVGPADTRDGEKKWRIKRVFLIFAESKEGLLS